LGVAVWTGRQRVQLTQSHIENHGDMLAGTILCGTLGAIPGLSEDRYETVIKELRWRCSVLPAVLSTSMAREPGHVS
jgi:hypothetical protein